MGDPEPLQDLCEDELVDLVVLRDEDFHRWRMGAFLAGVLLAESSYRHELEADIEPFRGILQALFFMGGTPDLMFIIDTNKESIAIDEAKRLGIPVVAVIDSNCDPDQIDYAIPGNDDASRAIALYCDLIARAAIDGIARQQGAAGRDLGASEEVPVEPALEEASEA